LSLSPYLSFFGDKKRLGSLWLVLDSSFVERSKLLSYLFELESLTSMILDFDLSPMSDFGHKEGSGQGFEKGRGPASSLRRKRERGASALFSLAPIDPEYSVSLF
jgi:hypothetical protein